MTGWWKLHCRNQCSPNFKWRKLTSNNFYKGVIMSFKVNFNVESANTLSPEEVFGPNHTWKDVGQYSYTHQDGWTISGTICEDYYTWVNDFEATHADLGFVKGNFESQVEASSQEAYEHFIERHPPYEWDYYDI